MLKRAKTGARHLHHLVTKVGPSTDDYWLTRAEYESIRLCGYGLRL